MENSTPENKEIPQKEIPPIDTVWLSQWLRVFQENQIAQINLLKSIQGMLQFFVVLIVISIIIESCSALIP